MSTSEEIQSVYEDSIYQQTKLVESKSGKAPFYENFEGFSFENVFSGLGIEKIRCSEYYPATKKWSKKYAKTNGDVV